MPPRARSPLTTGGCVRVPPAHTCQLFLSRSPSVYTPLIFTHTHTHNTLSTQLPTACWGELNSAAGGPRFNSINHYKNVFFNFAFTIAFFLIQLGFSFFFFIMYTAGIHRQRGSGHTRSNIGQCVMKRFNYNELT